MNDGTMTRAPYPILEYDTAREAVLNPSSMRIPPFGADRMVITFFPEVVERLLAEGDVRVERVIPGENPLTVYAFSDDPGTLLWLGQVGCPACAGNLDLFHEMGIRRVMFCGGGGVLDPSVTVGRLLVVDGAIRDEGFSYHYLPPARVVYADRHASDTVAALLDAEGIPFLRGLTWTTDAIFRETPARVARRREEGAVIVEMEQAGCLAVAGVRGFAYGAIIYGGDDVSQDTWSNRGWRSTGDLRYALVGLCRRIVREL